MFWMILVLSVVLVVVIRSFSGLALYSDMPGYVGMFASRHPYVLFFVLLYFSAMVMVLVRDFRNIGRK